MEAEPGKEPLLPARGALLIEDFCRATGLDQDTIKGLARSGDIQGGLWRDEERRHLFGILEDELPSRPHLVGLGLPVRADYEPETLRGGEMKETDAE